MTFTPPTTSDKFEMFCVAMRRTERNTMLLDSWADILGGESELRQFFIEFIYPSLCKRQNYNNGVDELVNYREVQRAVDEVVPLLVEAARESLSVGNRGKYARGYNDPLGIKHLLALIETSGTPVRRVTRDYVSWITPEDKGLIWEIARKVSAQNVVSIASNRLLRMPREFALNLTLDDYQRACQMVYDYQIFGTNRHMYATVGKFPKDALAGMSSAELIHVLEVVSLLPVGVKWNTVKGAIDNDIDMNLVYSFASSKV